MPLECGCDVWEEMYPAEEGIISFIRNWPQPTMSRGAAGAGVSGIVPAERLLSCRRHAEDQLKRFRFQNALRCAHTRIRMEQYLTGAGRCILHTGAWVTGGPPCVERVFAQTSIREEFCLHLNSEDLLFPPDAPYPTPLPAAPCTADARLNPRQSCQVEP